MPGPTECDGEVSTNSTVPGAGGSLPELLMVAERLRQKAPAIEQLKEESFSREVINTNVVILEGRPLSPSEKLDEPISNCYVNAEFTGDAVSTSSSGSRENHLYDESNDSIHTIAVEIDNVSSYKFEVLEPEAPGRTVSSLFIVMFSILGLTIITMIILTVVFNYGLLLMLVMIVIIFILIIILTNFCAMMYRI